MKMEYKCSYKHFYITNAHLWSILSASFLFINTHAYSLGLMRVLQNNYNKVVIFECSLISYIGASLFYNKVHKTAINPFWMFNYLFFLFIIIDTLLSVSKHHQKQLNIQNRYSYKDVRYLAKSQSTS